MRRKLGQLIPNEIAVLKALRNLRERGIEAAHGYDIAKEMQQVTQTPHLAAAGTVYRLLQHLEESRMIGGRWREGAAGGRRQQYYEYALTSEGEWALRQAEQRSAVIERESPIMRTAEA